MSIEFSDRCRDLSDDRQYRPARRPARQVSDGRRVIRSRASEQLVHHFARGSAPEIGVDELDDLLRDRGVRLLDVREDREFRRGHVPGAVSVPLGQLTGRIAELPRDKPYAVICEHGNRSLAETDFLLGRGFEGAASVRGGTDAWTRSNRPLERD